GLVPVAAVDGRTRYPGLLRDAVDRQALVALLAHQPLRGLENQAVRLRVHLAARPAPRLFLGRHRAELYARFIMLRDATKCIGNPKNKAGFSWHDYNSTAPRQS